MCKDRKKLSNTEQKITKCNRKVFHVEHCKCFTWNIVSVSRGTSQAFHVEHRKRFTWNIASVSRGTPTAHRRGRLRSASLFPPPCSGLRARLWAAAFGIASSSSLFGLACSAVGGCVRLRFFLLLVRACVLGCGRRRSSSLLPPPCSGLRARLWAASLALLSCRPRLCALRPLCVVVCRSPLLPSSPVRRWCSTWNACDVPRGTLAMFHVKRLQCST